MDSSQASALTFRLLNAGVPVLRDPTTGAVSFAAESAPADLDAMARSLFVDVTASNAPATGTALRLPKIGLFAGSGISTTSGSYGEARFIIEQRWQATDTPVTAADINNNTATFTDQDVLVVPDGTSSNGGLTAAGLANLKAWVGNGGIYIGLRREGERLARTAGLTSTTEKPNPAGYQVLGSHFRVDVSSASPVALVDEPYGTGHAVLFSYDPLFRAYEESGEHLFANAVLYPVNGLTARKSLTAGTVNLAAPLGRVDAAEAQHAPLEDDVYTSTWRPITIQVAASDFERANAIIQRYVQPDRVDQVGGSVFFVIANPQGLDAEEHPFANDLIISLQSAGIRLLSFSL